MTAPGVRVGVDIGGVFTDLALVGGDGRRHRKTATVRR